MKVRDDHDTFLLISDLQRSGLALRVDASARDEAAGDFGHIVRRRPLGVVRPSSVDEICQVVRLARQYGLKLAPRGGGYSTYGNAQVNGGIVVDMTGLNAIHSVEAEKIIVDGGARWVDVFRSAADHGLTPPVLTSFLDVTVAGTLSMGGVSRQSVRGGLQVDTALSLDVVTGAGDLVTCSASCERDLFHAALGGMGQCGIIARATIRLVPMPARARILRLFYEDPDVVSKDLLSLVEGERLSSIIGWIMPAPSGGLLYCVEVSFFHSPPEEPDIAVILEGLSDNRAMLQVDDKAYVEFADGRDVRALMDQAEFSALAHPWFLTFIPATAFTGCLREALASLSPADIGARVLIAFGAFRSDRIHRPLPRIPAGGRFFVLDLAWSAPRDPKAIQENLTQNRALWERIRDAGGVLQPTSAVDFRPEDWKMNFGSHWEWFRDAKRRYDPDFVLSPGQDVFEAF
jgi:cytokinin dehydrogenase